MGDDGSRYYEEELAYLVEAGREYARLHPDRARRLNLQDARARDPHVERLVEAFAFLAGNVRKRLDDDFPELTTALLELVWPHFLKPIPPFALLQFRPVPGMVREMQVVPRGFVVESEPTSAGVACRFTTCYPVEIQPIELSSAAVLTDDAGQRFLRMRLAVVEGADPAAIRIERLRLHLFGEPTAAMTSYRLLRTALASVTVRTGRDRTRVLQPSCVHPLGLGQDDEVVAAPRVSFPGYRLLAEYFAFREKFLFLDVVGIGALGLTAQERSFELDFRFTERLPDAYRPSTDEFRLFTTPVANLFPQHGEPVLVTHERQRYRVLGDYSHPEDVEVISISSVEGIGRRTGVRRRYAPFFSFEHEQGSDDGTYVHPTFAPSPAGGWHAFVSLVSRGAGAPPEDVTLSFELECSNGRLCREVGLESIRVASGPSLDFATFRNITRPTDPIYPRLGDGAGWDLVSHLSLNLLSLTDAAALRRMLALYDPAAASENRRRIDAVRHLRARERERLVRGTAIRGTELELEIDDAAFSGDGDLLLFREVLAEFLSLFASINSFVQLTMIKGSTGEVLRCPPSTGRQRLI